MTGPEHYRHAEELLISADDWLNADTGWRAGLSTEERLARRSADAAAAQVHATLALAAATALGEHGPAGHDYDRWRAVAAAPARTGGNQ